jgi:hypothetical protein
MKTRLILILVVLLLLFGCGTAESTTSKPASGSEQSRQWTDSAQANSINFYFAAVAKASPNTLDTNEDGRLVPVNPEVSFLGPDGVPVTVPSDGAVYFVNSPIHIWTDTASAAERDGEGSTVAGGGDDGDSEQDVSRKTDIPVDVDGLPVGG